MFTDAGRNMLAEWLNDHSKKVDIKWIGVGAAPAESYEYDGTETGMSDVRYIGSVQRTYIEEDSRDIVRVEAVFDPDSPSPVPGFVNSRGWSAGEIALFAEDPSYPGDFSHAVMIWIEKHPEIYIPQEYEHAAVLEIITVPIRFSNVEAVTLYTNGAGLATLTQLEQAHIAAIAYAGTQAIEAAEMNGMILAKIAQLHP